MANKLKKDMTPEELEAFRIKKKLEKRVQQFGKEILLMEESEFKKLTRKELEELRKRNHARKKNLSYWNSVKDVKLKERRDKTKKAVDDFFENFRKKI